jgi:hypothetical protein
MKTTMLIKNESILHETACDTAAPSYTVGDEFGADDEPVGALLADPDPGPEAVGEELAA